MARGVKRWRGKDARTVAAFRSSWSPACAYTALAGRHVDEGWDAVGASFPRESFKRRRREEPGPGAGWTDPPGRGAGGLPTHPGVRVTRLGAGPGRVAGCWLEGGYLFVAASHTCHLPQTGAWPNMLTTLQGYMSPSSPKIAPTGRCWWPESKG